jgi:hypothetical protein
MRYSGVCFCESCLGKKPVSKLEQVSKCHRYEVLLLIRDLMVRYVFAMLKNIQKTADEYD